MAKNDIFSYLIPLIPYLVVCTLLINIIFPVSLYALENKVSEEKQIKDEEKGACIEKEASDKKSSDKQIIDDIEISIKPKVNETINSECIHPPLSVKYGINPDWEFNFRLNTFLNNPLKGRSRNGVSDVTVGTKYHWKGLLKYDIDTITAFSVQIPAGSSEDISDEYTHYRPELKFIKTVPEWKKVQLSTTIKMDILSGYSEEAETLNQDTLDDSLILDNSLTFTIGALFPVYPFNYIFEAEWISTEIDGGNQNIVYLTSGVFYDVQEKKHPWIRGEMQLGLGVRFGLHDTEDSFAFFARLNWDLPFKMRLKKGSKEEKKISP
ncbi:MAG: hypothetical protein ACMUIU_13755 [bacterium]